MIKNLGFTFVTINPDVENFDAGVQVARIYNYINEWPEKLAVNLAKKPLKEKFSKELMSYMWSISKPLSSILLEKYCHHYKNDW